MQTTYIFVSQIWQFWEREREKCENCKRPSLSTNEAEFNYLKYSLFYPLIAEKYKDSVSINKSRVTALTRSLWASECDLRSLCASGVYELR